MSPDAVLRMSDLAVGFDPAAPLLRKLDAEIAGGELVCLLGPNGTGKTTLLRTVLGLHPPLGGEISLLGRGLTGLNRQARARLVGMVFPGRLLAGHLTVHELVALGRLPWTSWTGRPSDRDLCMAEQALVRVEAETLRERRVGTLSDGERQRVLIARALAQDTPLLLLDEPTAFLDLGNRVQVFRLLLALARDEGKSVLMSTHDLDLAMRHADRLWLIRPRRRTLETGAPEDLWLEGVLQETFARQGLSFDADTGAVELASERRGRISVVGSSTRPQWIRRALHRAGWEVDDADSAVMQVGWDAAAAVYVLDRPGQAPVRCESLYRLLSVLTAATVSDGAVGGVRKVQ